MRTKTLSMFKCGFNYKYKNGRTWRKLFDFWLTMKSHHILIRRQLYHLHVICIDTAFFSLFVIQKFDRVFDIVLLSFTEEKQKSDTSSCRQWNEKTRICNSIRFYNWLKYNIRYIYMIVMKRKSNHFCFYSLVVGR